VIAKDYIMSDMEKVYCRIYGRVQLVMFRDFATRKARKLSLVGFVRNLKDGSVEAYAQGEREALEKWIAYLGKGPLLSSVEKVEAQWGKEPPSDMARVRFESFDVIS
jgi:acylphosphatase